MNQMSNLYRQVIMEHHKNPRNKGLVKDDNYRTMRLKNPSCGDDVTIQLKSDEHQIKDIRHEGFGCSICCASASVMSEVLKNKSVVEAENIIEDFYALIKGDEVKDEDSLDEAIAFSGVSQFPARVKCATLAWKALGALLVGEDGEGDIDE